MASLNPDNSQNPAVRCVTSSKLPMCDDAQLPLKEVYGLVEVISPATVVSQDTFMRIPFVAANPTAAINCVWDAPNNEFVMLCAGNYAISYDLTINDGSTSNANNAFISINAPATGAGGSNTVPPRLGGQGNSPVANGGFINVNGSVITPLAVGDRVGVYMADDVDGDDVSLLEQGRLSIHSLIGNFE